MHADTPSAVLNARIRWPGSCKQPAHWRNPAASLQAQPAACICTTHTKTMLLSSGTKNINCWPNRLYCTGQPCAACTLPRTDLTPPKAARAPASRNMDLEHSRNTATPSLPLPPLGWTWVWWYYLHAPDPLAQNAGAQQTSSGRCEGAAGQAACNSANNSPRPARPPHTANMPWVG